MRNKHFIAAAWVCLSGYMMAGPVAADVPLLADVIQMPVAVDRALEVGLPEDQVREIAGILIERGDSGRIFNETMRASIEGLSASSQEPEMGGFVVDRVRGGLRGRDLAAAIHARLNERGIPAGGWKETGVSPVDGDFISQHVRERMSGRRAGGPGNSRDSRHGHLSEQAVEPRHRTAHDSAVERQRPGGNAGGGRDTHGGRETRGRAPGDAGGQPHGGPPDGRQGGPR